MKLLTRILSIFLLLPIAVYAEPNSSFSGKNITFNATEGVEMCSGTDSIKLAVGCTGGGTTHVLELDTAGDLALPGGLALGDSISLVNGATTASLTVNGGLLSLDSTGVTQFKRNGTAYAQLSTGSFHPATNAGSTLGSTVYGWNTLYLGAATGKVVQNTIDGSDNRATCLAGGSDCAYANGGYIFTYGNESGSKGDVFISAGDAAGSDVTIRAIATGSTVSMMAGNQNILTLSSTQAAFADGTYTDPSMTFISDDNTGFYRLASDTIGVVGGGALLLGIYPDAINGQTNTPFAPSRSAQPAAGSTTADATVLDHQVVSVFGADGTKGVRIRDNTAVGVFVMYYNRNTSNTLKVYPPTGMSFNDGSSNAPYIVQPSSMFIAFRIAGNNWYASDF